MPNNNPTIKTLQRVVRSAGSHWVGDGFPVRSMFDYAGLGREALSPFLLMDYAGPHKFAPASAPRGVGEHLTGASRPSRSPTKAKSPTATLPAAAVSSAPAMCSG